MKSFSQLQKHLEKLQDEYSKQNKPHSNLSTEENNSAYFRIQKFQELSNAFIGM
jgi:hypothetical protein